jgi:hypothetical protein
VVAAAGADHLEYLVVAALDAVVHDAYRLFPQDGLAAVAGLTGKWGCCDLARDDAQPRVPVIAVLRYGGRFRSATRRGVRGARTAQ